MKKILLLLLLLFVGIQGCKKETFEDIPTTENVEKKDYQIIFETPEELVTWLNHQLGRVEFRPEQFIGVFKRANGPLCYDTADLLAFLVEYGRKAIDYIPTWNNYFQDANCNVAQWQYFGAERDALSGEGFGSNIIPDSVVWNIDGILVTTYPDDASPNQNAGNLWFQTYSQDIEGNLTPNCGFFQPACNGGHDATVTVYIDGAIYQRSAAGWAQVNSVPDDFPYCAPYGSGYSEPSATFDWAGCGCPFVFEQYQFMLDSGLEWDLDNDGMVATTDLLHFLVDYGC